MEMKENYLQVDFNKSKSDSHMGNAYLESPHHCSTTRVGEKKATTINLQRTHNL